MKSVSKIISNQLIVKNSKFICILYPLNDLNDFNKYMMEVKENYPKASHYCYAYIYNDIYLSSDDGEPSGTAGRPILNVLQKEDLTNVLCVVVRYFGGIKLGAGGLVRAYTKSVSSTLEISDIVELEKGYKIRLEFEYDEASDISYLLGDSYITDKSFTDKVVYICLVSENTFLKLNKYKTEIIEKVLIKKS